MLCADFHPPTTPDAWRHVAPRGVVLSPLTSIKVYYDGAYTYYLSSIHALIS